MAMDQWITAAMADDSMVVELLVRLKQSNNSHPAPSVYPPERWGIRLPRSRPALRYDSYKKDGCGGGDRSRGSPTTPLSWSCGGGGGAATPSPSATADCQEANSLPSSRSKVMGTTETATSSSRRLKKKRTNAELRDAESMELKEWRNLKTEISRLRSTLKEQKVRNQKLKRIKLDLSSQFEKKTSPNGPQDEYLNRPHEEETLTVNQGPSVLSTYAISNSIPPSVSCTPEREGFMLPDLNMMPSEDDDS